MFPYMNTKKSFLEDKNLYNNLLKGTKNILGSTGGSEEEKEHSDWVNSIGIYMKEIIKETDLPDDTIIGLEMTLEMGGTKDKDGLLVTGDKTPDMVIAGYGKDGKKHMLFIELKQWSNIIRVEKDSDGDLRYYQSYLSAPKKHPAKQVEEYVELMKKYNSEVRKGEVIIDGCVFMHNLDGDSICRERDVSAAIKECNKKDVQLADCSCSFNKTQSEIYNLAYKVEADGGTIIETYYCNSKEDFVKGINAIFASKSEKQEGKNGISVIRSFKRGMPGIDFDLKNSLGSISELKKEDYEHKEGIRIIRKPNSDEALFILRADQRYVLKSLMSEIDKLNGKHHGKGKAIIVEGGPGSGKTLLALLLQRYCECRNLSCYYGYTRAAMNDEYHSEEGHRGYIGAVQGKYDVIICDEANGNIKQYNCNCLKENSKLTIFFFDKDQYRQGSDATGEEFINKLTEVYGQGNVNVEPMRLTSQFRCGQDDGYLRWVEAMLSEDEETKENYIFDFDVEIIESGELTRDRVDDIIKEGEKDGKTVKFLWHKWGGAEQLVKNTGLSFYGGGARTYPMFMSTANPREIGSIYGVHGLECDVAVVFLAGDRAALYTEEKNTYRVLLTRAKSKCYICCKHKKVAKRLKRSLARMNNALY